MGVVFKYFLVFALVFTASGIFAQGGDKFHEVKAGETKYGISRQYNITIEELEKFNPEIREGLKVGIKLLIPEPDPEKKDTTVQSQNDGKFIIHRVKAQETLYSLSRTYGVSIQQIVANNPAVRDGLQIGSELKIPMPKGNTNESGDFHYYTVKPSENVNQIAGKLKMSVDSLYLLNPNLKKGLTIGAQLKIPLQDTSVDYSGSTPPVRYEETKDPKTQNPGDTTDTYFLYQVKTGDSFYSLKQKFNVSREELIKYNPELEQGLNLDKYIIVPKKEEVQKKDTGWLDKLFNKVDPEVYSEENRQPATAETEDIPKTGKIDSLRYDEHRMFNVAMMLPFDISESDTVAESKEGYSRVALEFYNGFLIAADSMINAGMNINLTVKDTRNSLIKIKDDLPSIRNVNPDIVIGPLFKDKVEYVADELKEANIPVISPLSKSVEVKGRKNLIQTIPGPQETSAHIANLINRDFNRANLIFAHSGEKSELNDALHIMTGINSRPDENYIKEVAAISSSSNIFSASAINNVLSEKRQNVIVITSENSVLLSDLINKLRNKKDTDLYVIAPSKMVRIPTIEVDYLNKLNLIMPDVNFVDYEDAATKKFIAEYRHRFNDEPSRFAIQGYDIGMYFLPRLRSSGKHLTDNLKGTSTMTGSGYKLISTPGGGYQNQFLFSTGIRNFTLVKIDRRIIELD